VAFEEEVAMLEGKLVRLRAREPDDLERAYAWINDGEVTHQLTLRYPLSRADEERRLREMPSNTFANGVNLAIESTGGVYLGNIELREMRHEDRKAELAIMIGEKEYWSQGYGVDAVLTLLRFAFHEMNLNRVWLTVHVSNGRAIACYAKCGFQEEGRLRYEVFRDGCYRDVLVMGILRREFEALHRGGTAQTERTE
jgi:RimJ/RimL family protein N-acetyltransferase